MPWLGIERLLFRRPPTSASGRKTLGGHLLRQCPDICLVSLTSPTASARINLGTDEALSITHIFFLRGAHRFFCPKG